MTAEQRRRPGRLKTQNMKINGEVKVWELRHGCKDNLKKLELLRTI